MEPIKFLAYLSLFGLDFLLFATESILSETTADQMGSLLGKDMKRGIPSKNSTVLVYPRYREADVGASFRSCSCLSQSLM